MSTRPRLSSSLGIYHVIYRGINKQRIFESPEDYEKYLSVLRKYQSICGYKLIAYCLMSNHIHLLIKPGEIPLARIFQRVSPSFVYWYNRKYRRVGSLFQARFLSRPINSREQLLIVTRYIHQNPVKASICNHPEQYKYSSFQKYFANDLIDSSLVLSEFNREQFFEFNCKENNDCCLDIDREISRLNDEAATEIMQELSGCGSVSEFQSLNTVQRDNVLCHMRLKRISMKQASRITGISYGVIKKVFAQAAKDAGCSQRPGDRANYSKDILPGGSGPRGRSSGFSDPKSSDPRGRSSGQSSGSSDPRGQTSLALI